MSIDYYTVREYEDGPLKRFKEVCENVNWGFVKVDVEELRDLVEYAEYWKRGYQAELGLD